MRRGSATRSRSSLVQKSILSHDRVTKQLYCHAKRSQITDRFQTTTILTIIHQGPSTSRRKVSTIVLRQDVKISRVHAFHKHAISFVSPWPRWTLSCFFFRGLGCCRICSILVIQILRIQMVGSSTKGGRHLLTILFPRERRRKHFG